jgi:hypothetical protein
MRMLLSVGCERRCFTCTTPGVEIPKLDYQILTKSYIKPVFEHFGVKLDHRPYVAAASVFPMRTNSYVVKLIDWSKVPDDPIFQLVFPQPGMLAPVCTYSNTKDSR